MTPIPCLSPPKGKPLGTPKPYIRIAALAGGPGRSDLPDRDPDLSGIYLVIQKLRICNATSITLATKNCEIWWTKIRA